VPLVTAGLLIVLFSIEHIIALLRNQEVSPHGTSDPQRCVLWPAGAGRAVAFSIGLSALVTILYEGLPWPSSFSR